MRPALSNSPFGTGCLHFYKLATHFGPAAPFRVAPSEAVVFPFRITIFYFAFFRYGTPLTIQSGAGLFLR
jgi:hypothetical protein